MHTIYVSLLYIVLFFSLALIIDNKHNVGIMVLQTHLPSTGIFKKKTKNTHIKKKQAFMTLFILVVCLAFYLILAINSNPI